MSTLENNSICDQIERGLVLVLTHKQCNEGLDDGNVLEYWLNSKFLIFWWILRLNKMFFGKY